MVHYETLVIVDIGSLWLSGHYLLWFTLVEWSSITLVHSWTLALISVVRSLGLVFLLLAQTFHHISHSSHGCIDRCIWW